MKNVFILIPETAVTTAVFGTQYMFMAINNFYKEAGHEQIFNVQLIGLTDNSYFK